MKLTLLLIIGVVLWGKCTLKDSHLSVGQTKQSISIPYYKESPQVDSLIKSTLKKLGKKKNPFLIRITKIPALNNLYNFSLYELANKGAVISLDTTYIKLRGYFDFHGSEVFLAGEEEPFNLFIKTEKINTINVVIVKPTTSTDNKNPLPYRNIFKFEHGRFVDGLLRQY